MSPHPALCLVILATLSIRGATAECNPAVAVETDGNCVCKTANLLYNYKEHSCQEERELFFENGCGPHATSQENDCVCDEAFLLNDSTGLCEDEDLCSSAPCGVTEVCYNNYGPETCKCKDTYRRTETFCEDLDESLNPQWNDCQQTVTNFPGGFICSCRSMYNSANNGKECTLKSEYEDCSTDAGVICVENRASGEQQWFPMRGFKLVTDTTAEDIDECVEFQGPKCWLNSHCKNLGDGQGYECVCDEGYTDAIFNDTNVKECVPERCLQGEFFDCVDPCADITCGSNQVCLEGNPNIATCVEPLNLTIFTEALPGNLFTGTLEAWDPETFASRITSSLEVIFGSSSAQVTRSANKRETFDFTVVANTNDTIVEQRLADYCLSLQMMPGHCELPLGVVVNSSLTVNPVGEEDLCSVNPCPDTHTCNASGRRCECIEGPTENFIDFIEVCDVSGELEDLKQQVIDAEDSLKVTAAVLGTLLGLALVAIVVLVFFKKGQFCSS